MAPRAAAVLTALTEMMKAVNAGDARRYARLYAPDAVITIHGSGELKGRGAIERHEVELLREFPGARLAFYAVWHKDRQAVVHYGVNGRTPGGQSMGHEGLLFYRFAPSGLIEDEHRYLDSLTPMAQMGLLGAVPARSMPTLPTDLNAYAATGSRTEEENVAVVKAVVAAMDSKDAPAFFSSMADDAVIDDLMHPRPFVGKRNVEVWFETWIRAVPDASTEIGTILGVGDYVLMEAVVRGTLKGPLGLLSPSSGAFTVHRAVIAHLEGRRLARMWVFMNGKEIAQAVGQWPPPRRK